MKQSKSREAEDDLYSEFASHTHRSFAIPMPYIPSTTATTTTSSNSSLASLSRPNNSPEINIDMMTLMQCDVSWMGGLVIYGGLRRRNERDSESRSLMLEFLPRFLHRFMSK